MSFLDFSSGLFILTFLQRHNDNVPSPSTEHLHHRACSSLCSHGKELPQQVLGVLQKLFPLKPHTALKSFTDGETEAL